MKQILAAYIISVLANRLFNWFWWWGRNIKAGPLAYYKEHGPSLAATAILHVFVFPLWNLGLLLPIINKLLAGGLAVADVVGADIAIPPFTQVDPTVTLACGWMIDSITSRIGMILGSKFAFFPTKTNEDAPPETKETP